MMELCRGYINVAKDCADNSATQILAAMIRNRGRASVGVNKKAMAAFLPRLYES